MTSLSMDLPILQQRRVGRTLRMKSPLRYGIALWGLSLLLTFAVAGVSRAANDLAVIAPPDRSGVESRMISIVVRGGGCHR